MLIRSVGCFEICMECESPGCVASGFEGAAPFFFFFFLGGCDLSSSSCFLGGCDLSSSSCAADWRWGFLRLAPVLHFVSMGLAGYLIYLEMNRNVQICHIETQYQFCLLMLESPILKRCTPQKSHETNETSSKKPLANPKCSQHKDDIM